MDYSRFLRLRSRIWEEFEKRLDAARRDVDKLSYRELDELAFQYRQILHDYALASARFPGTGAARKLSRLSLEGTHWLQWDRPDRLPGPIYFITQAFPLTFRRELPHFLLALGLFAVAALLGVTLSVVQPGIGTALLGPQAIAGLERGKLWTDSLTTTVPPSFSSSFIATNNMSVAITGWAGGALFGLGSLYVVLLNGFMLGAVFGITWHYSIAHRLFEFVSAHGPLEITLILVTAGAGLGIGRALVEATDRSRSEAVPAAARSALVILLGCLPWFLILGLVESFVSPSPALGPSFKLTLGAALEALFLMMAWNPFLGETRR